MAKIHCPCNDSKCKIALTISSEGIEITDKKGGCSLMYLNESTVIQLMSVFRNWYIEKIVENVTGE